MSNIDHFFSALFYIDNDSAEEKNLYLGHTSHLSSFLYVSNYFMREIDGLKAELRPLECLAFQTSKVDTNTKSLYSTLAVIFLPLEEITG